jgi:hypothetical protein
MLRSVPPSSSYAAELTTRATSIMRGGLARLLGLRNSSVTETDSWWLQGTLPPAMGGFGIIDPSLIHHVSFLACEAAVSDSILALQLARNLPPPPPSEDARRTFDSHCTDKDLYPDLPTLFVESYKLQHRLSVELYKKRSNELRQRDPAIAARLDSCSEEGAVLVTCIPNHPGLTIANGEKMQERLCMRAGLAIPYIVCGPCTSCGKPGAYVDAQNFHLLSGCNAGGERYRNHNGVRDSLLDLCKEGTMTCRPGGRSVCLAHEPGTRKSVDMTVDNFDGPVPLGIDVSVTDPRQTTYFRARRPIVPGRASLDREKFKVGKYTEAYVSQQCLFEPFVLESFGRFGNRTRSLFNQIVDRVQASKDSQSSPFMKNHWRMRVVMALHINACNGVRERMDEVLLGRRGECSAEKVTRAWTDYDTLARCRY